MACGQVNISTLTSLNGSSSALLPNGTESDQLSSYDELLDRDQLVEIEQQPNTNHHHIHNHNHHHNRQQPLEEQPPPPPSTVRTSVALEEHSIHSLEELESISELEARLGLRPSTLESMNGSQDLTHMQNGFEGGRLRFMTEDDHHGYVEQFRHLFDHLDVDHRLIQIAIDGKLRSSCFRSLCWKIFLKVIPDNWEGWDESIEQSRSHYRQIRLQYETECRQQKQEEEEKEEEEKQKLIKQDNTEVNNPLSTEEDSWWHRHFKNAELRAVIEQDVNRTFPEVDFFHQPEVQQLLQRLLFLYARQHPDVQYKQGMHELLAPLVFVLHCDHQAFLHAKENHILREDDDLTRRLQVQLEERHLESDAYNLFSKLMNYVKPWYLPESDCHNKQKEVQPFSQLQQMLSLSILGQKLHHISESLLKSNDLPVYQQLQRLQIEPQIYGIRWLRLLFGREFAIEDLLIVWDVIFAKQFQTIDHIFTAMLIVIRRLLLNGDYSECMGHLMRYPHVPDVGYIIQLALHLHDPQSNPEPDEFSLNVMPSEMHSPFSKRSGLKEFKVINDDEQQSSIIDQDRSSKAGSKIISFAQRLLSNSNRKQSRERSYTTPAKSSSSAAAAAAHPTAMSKQESQPSLSSAMFDRLKLMPNNDSGNRPKVKIRPVNNSWASASELSSAPTSPTFTDSSEFPLQSAQRHFCVQHLTKQIQTLQATLQQASCEETEEEANQDRRRPVDQSEDTLALAIAELKKIRDVLEGSLSLDNVKQTEELMIKSNSIESASSHRLIVDTSSSAKVQEAKKNRDSGEFAGMHATLQD